VRRVDLLKREFGGEKKPRLLFGGMVKKYNEGRNPVVAVGKVRKIRKGRGQNLASKRSVEGPLRAKRCLGGYED